MPTPHHLQGIVTVNLQTSRLKAVDPMAVFRGDDTALDFLEEEFLDAVKASLGS